MAGKKKVIQSGMWQLLNAAVKTGSHFVFYALMARLLPNAKAELGIFAILNSFMNMGHILGDGGMGDAVLQRKDPDKGHINAAFWSGMFLSLIVYLIIFIAAPYIADFYNEPRLTFSLQVFSLMFLLASGGAASLNLMQKKFKFKKIFLGDGIFLLLSNVVGIFMAWQGMDFMAIVYSQLLYYAIRMILFLLAEPIPVRAGFNKEQWREMFSYGGSLTLIRVNNYVANFGIVLEVGKLVSQALLGVFDRTYRIMNIPQRFLYDTVQRVMMPAMVSKMGGNKAVFSVFSKTMSLMNTIMVPLTVFLVVFTRPVIEILLGPKWVDDETVLLMQICFLNLPLRMTSSLGDTLMRVYNLINVNLVRKVINSIAILVFIFIGFQWNGLIGIGWALFASTILSYIQMLLVIKNRIYPDQWKELLWKPYINGFLLSLSWVLPATLLHGAISFIIEDVVLRFIVVVILVGMVAVVAFLKKPRLLGEDIAYIQPDLLGMFKKGKGLNKKRKFGTEPDFDEQQHNLH
jgi:O-antigen/teichoic acid export membrane protein